MERLNHATKNNFKAMQKREVQITKKMEEAITYTIDRPIYLKTYWGVYYMVTPTHTLHIIGAAREGERLTDVLVNIKTTDNGSIEVLSKWLNGTERMEEIGATEFWEAWGKAMQLVVEVNEERFKELGKEMDKLVIKEVEL